MLVDRFRIDFPSWTIVSRFSIRKPWVVICCSIVFVLIFLPGLSRVQDLTVSEAKLLWVDQGSRARKFDMWASDHYQEFGRPQFVKVTKGSGVGDYENVLDEVGCCEQFPITTTLPWIIGRVLVIGNSVSVERTRSALTVRLEDQERNQHFCRYYPLFGCNCSLKIELYNASSEIL